MDAHRKFGAHRESNNFHLSTYFFFAILISLHRRMVEIGYLAACQTFYHKLVANISIDNRMRHRANHLGMEHFIGAFILLAGGSVLSSLVFVGEILISRKQHHRKVSFFSCIIHTCSTFFIHLRIPILASRKLAHSNESFFE